MIDITNLSNAALEVVLAARTNAVVDVDHLTVTERRQVAAALGFEAPVSWLVNATCDDNVDSDERDYEGMILDHQERL